MMTLLLKGVGCSLALLFIVASGAMNFVFLTAQGHTPLESKVLGLVSIAADGSKAVLPVLIALAWRHGLWKYVFAGSTAFVVFLTLGLMSAVGFAAMARGAVSGDRDALNGKLALVERELAEVDARLQGASVRAIGVIEQEISRHRQSPLWKAASECTDANTAERRRYCADYFTLQGELAGALDTARRQEQQARLRTEVKVLRTQGAGQEADPQVSAIAKLAQRVLPAAELSDVKLSLILFIAFVVEFGAAFGLYLATGFDVRQPERRARLHSAPAVLHDARVSGSVQPEARDDAGDREPAAKVENSSMRTGHPAAAVEVVEAEPVTVTPFGPRRLTAARAAFLTAGRG